MKDSSGRSRNDDNDDGEDDDDAGERELSGEGKPIFFAARLLALSRAMYSFAAFFAAFCTIRGVPRIAMAFFWA